MKTLNILGLALLAFVLTGCIAFQPDRATIDEVATHANGKVEAQGLYVAVPSTGTVFGLGSLGMDVGETAAVYINCVEYEDGTEACGQHPLQATYKYSMTYPDGRIETVEITDGTSNCTNFEFAAGAEDINVDAGILKTFCMGLSSQDLAAGLIGVAE